MINRIKNPYKKIKEQEQSIQLLNKKIKELEGIPNTSIHPKYKKLIQEVKEINGRMLYQFRALLDMPHNRYNSCTRFSTELNLRLDVDTSIEIDKKILEECDKDKIRRTAITNLVNDRMIRTEMLISIEASYRLASCVYFWKDENLDEYDYEIGDEKIRLFKEIGFESFFLSKPMNNFLPQMDLSLNVLKAYSQHEKELQSLLSRQLNGPKEENTKTI